jgi:hypothetical protein
MKTFIVILSTVVLGLAIAGFVHAFQAPLEDLSDDSVHKIEQIQTTTSAISVTITG